MFRIFILVLTLLHTGLVVKINKGRLPIPCNPPITVCEPNGDGEVCYPIDPEPPCPD